MIIRNNTQPKIERVKQQLGLVGDVYMVEHFIESFESHKRLMPESAASTIAEAEQERIAFVQQERLQSSEPTTEAVGQIEGVMNECQSEKL